MQRGYTQAVNAFDKFIQFPSLQNDEDIQQECHKLKAHLDNLNECFCHISTSASTNLKTTTAAENQTQQPMNQPKLTKKQPRKNRKTAASRNCYSKIEI